MNLPRLAVERPITTVMLLVSVLVIGGIAVTRLPLAYLPEVDAPEISREKTDDPQLKLSQDSST